MAVQVTNTLVFPHMHFKLGEGLDWLRAVARDYGVVPRRVLLCADTADNTVQQYADLHPQLEIMLRPWVAREDVFIAQGFAGGQRYVNQVASLQRVRWLKIGNENVTKDVAIAARFNDFTMGALAALKARNAPLAPEKRTLPLTIASSVGELEPYTMPYLKPSVDETLAQGGAIALQMYGPWNPDIDAQWLAWRWPLLLVPILNQLGTINIRMIGLEALWDYVGDEDEYPHLHGPWRRLMGKTLPSGEVFNVAYMIRTLRRVISQLRERNVDGLTLYTFGPPDGQQNAQYDYLAEPYGTDFRTELAKLWREGIGTPEPPPNPGPTTHQLELIVDSARLRNQPVLANSTICGRVPRGPASAPTRLPYIGTETRGTEMFYVIAPGLYIHSSVVRPV